MLTSKALVLIHAQLNQQYVISISLAFGITMRELMLMDGMMDF